ncbi:unnamed protein product [Schistocephalus solidus]|uniref:Uncharacterized protein n=1 Tax=Schistocephalus solidus TaxID=70667 RepID=A0A3P7FAN9_SCHSO|nr:unnamed protein product [Schistocephalus solidus]
MRQQLGNLATQHRWEDLHPYSSQSSERSPRTGSAPESLCGFRRHCGTTDMIFATH